jgi:hypothetical protein
VSRKIPKYVFDGSCWRCSGTLRWTSDEADTGWYKCRDCGMQQTGPLMLPNEEDDDGHGDSS